MSQVKLGTSGIRKPQPNRTALSLGPHSSGDLQSGSGPNGLLQAPGALDPAGLWEAPHVFQGLLCAPAHASHGQPLARPVTSTISGEDSGPYYWPDILTDR